MLTSFSSLNLEPESREGVEFDQLHEPFGCVDLDGLCT